MAWKNKLATWAVDFLLVQLFINLVTWPLFLWWGLSITPLSIVGNLIFGPFLTLFLLLCSLITLCELIGIPDFIFLWILEKFTTFWLMLISCNGYDYPVAFAKPSLLLALCVPICTITIMLWKKLPRPHHRLAGLCVIYGIFGTLFSFTRTPTEITIPYGSKCVTVKKQGNKLTLVDPGFARRAASTNTWINYTLLPELAKNFGTQTVDTLVLEKKSPSVVACAQLLHKKAIAQELVYPASSLDTSPTGATRDERGNKKILKKFKKPLISSV